MRGRPTRLRQPLDTAAQEYAALVQPLWVLVDAIAARQTSPSGKLSIFAHMLKGMKEINESMRSIIRDAERFEEQSGKQSGRHYDAVFLARPQIELTINAILILHDASWLDRYERDAWANSLRSAYYSHLQVADPEHRDEWWEEYLMLCRKNQTKLGLSRDHEHAVLAQFEDLPLSREQKALLHEVSFPTAGQIVSTHSRLLRDSPFEHLSDLLWRYWQQYCHPAHAGLNAVGRKSWLRGDPMDTPLERDRESVINNDVVMNSVVPSMVAIVSLCTALVLRLHPDDEALRVNCMKAWDAMVPRLLMAAAVWDGWARRALGILEQPE